MLFIIHWSFTPQTRNAAIARFLKTGGAPPANLKVLGRWHAVGHQQGFGVVETDDLALVQKWVLDWSDLMTMEVFAAMTDTDIGPLLGATLSQTNA
ncbi:hypothetical protein DM813_12275 [Pseudomonas alkylphenolica]|uniref:DUF3303 domain-containing protein n=1 Tax=Pseudomonas alkylphenolica TaxID=237609 RepID=A0A443ZTL0_9PSED|nr:DUF3303 family protein [Pseudomonas alkylphenolica]RWU22967.1 hypothetical protein DM813_12275 [Pseudomonas alkylphenolica]